MRLPARLTLLLLVPALISTGACGRAPATLTLGGTTAVVGPDTVERPWGTVNVFPAMEKAENPGIDDVVFVQEMIMHHRQALELGRNLLVHEVVDERIAATARFIVQDQKNEIGIMRAWLSAWSASAGAHEHDASDMPGMLSQTQVDRVARLEDDAAQVAFVVGMIEHHHGAVTMSQDYLPVQGNAFTRSTAQHIITEQLTEIQYMENVLDDLCSEDGPPTCP